MGYINPPECNFPEAFSTQKNEQKTQLTTIGITDESPSHLYVISCHLVSDLSATAVDTEGKSLFWSLKALVCLFAPRWLGSDVMGGLMILSGRDVAGAVGLWLVLCMMTVACTALRGCVH